MTMLILDPPLPPHLPYLAYVPSILSAFILLPSTSKHATTHLSASVCT